MFTCSHCTFCHPFEWSLKEHMYVAHDDASNLKINSKNYRAPTKMYIGKNSEYAPTTVSIPPIRRGGAQSGMGVEYEDTESEHGDTDNTDKKTVGDLEQSEQSNTDEEMVDSEHEEHNHSDDETDNSEDMNEDEEREDSEDMNEDINYNNKFNLLHIINDTQALVEYCIILRKKNRKALKQLNNLDEDDTRAVFESYAKLEVNVKDEQYGIENENNDNDNEKNEDFWILWLNSEMLLRRILNY